MDMFAPEYTLTNKLLKNLTEIERLYGQIEALRLPKELQLNLERNNQVQSAYISNSIEGNPLSLPEVTNLLLGDRVPVNRDEKEVRNYFEILKELSNWTGREVTLEVMVEIHKKLMAGVKDGIAGVIRDSAVVIGARDVMGRVRIQHEPPYHQRGEIRSAINELFEWLSRADIPVPLKGGIWHHQFVYIHPFGDGNGRACRLLTALIFLKGNYQINKYFVLDDYYDIDRSMYSEKLHTADNGDKTVWLEYFTDGVKYSLQGALGKAKNSLSTLTVSNQPTPREKEVLGIFNEYSEVNSAIVAKLFSVTRQQAHKLLQSLVEQGLVEKHGSTKSSYYRLK
ncbi:MAG: Fic family protein [Microgenomates group bacterium Gr01-1014_16]|nr:MAG: Fic family protein [Microgenomates group bacterium Gr01-1014_16]